MSNSNLKSVEFQQKRRLSYFMAYRQDVGRPSEKILPKPWSRGLSSASPTYT